MKNIKKLRRNTKKLTAAMLLASMLMQGIQPAAVVFAQEIETESISVETDIETVTLIEEVTTEVSTAAIAESEAQSTAEIMTETVTESATELITAENPTQSVTESVTAEPASESVTEAVTAEPVTESITESVTADSASESVTEAVTAEPASESVTEPVTAEQPTQPVTEPVTVEQPTQPVTTEAVTEAATEPVILAPHTYTGEGYEIIFTPYSYSGDTINAGITIRNTGAEKIEDWKLIMQSDYASIESWGITLISQDDNIYTFNNASHNQDIAPGENCEITILATATAVASEISPQSLSLVTGKRTLNPTDFEITYEVTNQWLTGANCKIILHNLSDTVIEDWRLEFDFEGNIPHFWNAHTVSAENGHYSIINAGYNANIQPGATLEIGFGIVFETMPEAPTGYILNDLALSKVPEEYMLYVLYPLMVKKGLGKTADDIDLEADYDGDGLTNEKEYSLGTEPGVKDTDGDGLSDYDEHTLYGTDPTLYDTDRDGLGDGSELLNGFNPALYDTDGNGVSDGKERVENQLLTSESYKWADFTGAGAELSLAVTGTGDYSRRITVKNNPYEAVNERLSYMVTDIFDISHNDDMYYEGARLTFRLSEEILVAHSLEDLHIMRIEDDGPVLVETFHDEITGSIYADVDALCRYVVISESILIKESDFSESAAMLEDGKAEIVFLIDTTGSMGGTIISAINNIHRIAADLEENNIDARFGLVKFEDIYWDGTDSTVSYGWSETAEEFVTKLGLLHLGGGGDIPETPFDAMVKALELEGSAGYTKYYVVVTVLEPGEISHF